MPAALDEIRRVVTVFRELRSGVTADGRTSSKSPSGTLSTAEAISVVTNGLALAAHFGDGRLRAADVAAGIVGAVVKDPVADRVAWTEYLEAVARERPDWADFYAPAADVSRDERVSVRVFGIRHHGPGSARSLRARPGGASTPDAVLVEGPADADPLLAAGRRPGMEPPVALLAYVADDPADGRVLAVAVFSPGVAGDHLGAAGTGCASRFCDLPAGSHARRRTSASGEGRSAVRGDPLAALASAAGYDDPERWWDDVVESRLDGASPFPALTEAMAALREDHDPAADPRRRCGRPACAGCCGRRLKAGHERVAVVCGAWHAPALAGPLPPAGGRRPRAPRAGPRARCRSPGCRGRTRRLASASGYGAGVDVARAGTTTCGPPPTSRSPAGSPRSPRVLRSRTCRCPPRTSSRRSGSPTAWRRCAAGRWPGWPRSTEATRAVLCEGDEVCRSPASPTTSSSASGSAPCPTTAPTVPLEADLARTGRAPADQARGDRPQTLDLDLRKPNDLAGPGCCTGSGCSGSTGAPRPAARSRNRAPSARPGRWPGGRSCRSPWSRRRRGAPRSRRGHRRAGRPVAAAAGTLAELTADRWRPACWPTCRGRCAALLHALDERAALDADVVHLMEALPALVRAQRYGDVRGTDTAALGRVVDGAAGADLRRRCPRRSPASTTTPRRLLRRRIDEVHAAIGAASTHDGPTRWLATLAGLADRGRPPRPARRAGCVRLLRDAGAPRRDAAGRGCSARCRSASTPPEKAAWVEGFLAGGGAAAGPRRRPARAAGRLGRRAGRAGVRRRAAAAAADVRRVLRRRAARSIARRRRPGLRRRAAAAAADVDLERAAGGARHGRAAPGGADA